MRILRRLCAYVSVLLLILLVLLLFPHMQREEHNLMLEWNVSMDDLNDQIERADTLRAFQYKNRFGYIDPKIGVGFSYPSQNLVAQSDRVFVRKEPAEDAYLLFDATASFIQTIPVEGEITVHEDAVIILAENQRSVYVVQDGLIKKEDFNDAVVTSVFSSGNLVAYLFSVGLMDLQSRELLLRPRTTVVDYVNSGNLSVLLRVQEDELRSTVFEIYTRTNEQLRHELSYTLESSQAYIATNTTHSLVAFENTARIYARDYLAYEYSYEHKVDRVFASAELFVVISGGYTETPQVSVYAADAHFIAHIDLPTGGEVVSVVEEHILFGIQNTLLMIRF